MLDGMFSFVLFDKSVTPTRLIAARDPIGVTTLYQGWHSSDPSTVFFASELKAIHDVCDNLISFPPGHFYDSRTGKTERYYNPSWFDGPVPNTPVDLARLRDTLERAVRKRLMSEVPYGVLLSGGLDSSLIAAIASRESNKVADAQARGRSRSVARGQNVVGIDEDAEGDDIGSLAVWPRLHSFAVGLPGAPDLIAARTAAEYLDTVHHEFTFTVQEGLDAVSDVIYHLETYDVTTVRASTPMYLLSRKIKATGVKMVLSGEGSDEIFGGYLYFHAAPDKDSFHQECVSRVKNLHTADCLRANKCVSCPRFRRRGCTYAIRSTMAWGLEARVPFLDKEFLDVAMNVRPEDKVFGKGSAQETDADGRPRMEKVRSRFGCPWRGVAE
jgi:asparagine synthase (glutamine-hydrolysing)